LHNRIGTASLEEHLERQRGCASHFSVGIHDDVVLVVVAKPDGQRMAQLSLLRLGE
jgi:hypothetical protein